MVDNRNESGLESIVGTFVGAGVLCPQFRLEDGETVSLSGAVPAEITAGTELTLNGRWAFESKCMQGREFRVFE